MMLFLILLLLPLCNAQLLLEGILNEESREDPKPVNQPGYPYEETSEWIENIPNQNLPEIVYRNHEAHENATTSADPNLKLLEIDNRIQAILKIMEFPDENKSAENNDNVRDVDRMADKILKSSVFSKTLGNLTLSRKGSIRDRVTHLVNEGNALRNDTDTLVDQLHLMYLNLALDDTDNEVNTENLYKYGMSLILRFLFEFYRIFRKLSFQMTETQQRLTSLDVYRLSYDNAVAVMKRKKHYTPLEISAPIRRTMDIFKSILYESVIIIQTKCRTIDPNWKCIIIFLANLISERLNCSNVWYHAFLHMVSLQNIGIRESIVYNIANLERFKAFTYFENIFDFVIEKIEEYREVGRVQLSAEAIFFTMLADLHENGFLDCISIDYLYN